MSLEFLLRSFSGEDSPKVTTDKPLYDLAAMLQRERRRTKSRTVVRPMGKGFAPSAITYAYCKRAKVAQLLGCHEMYWELPAPKLQLTFDFGHAIHDIIQGYSWDADKLEGWFKCVLCNHRWYARSPTYCVKNGCGASRKYLKFKEVPIKHPTYRISGRHDGFVWYEEGTGKKAKEVRHGMDIKSIKARQPNTPEQEFCFEDLDQGPKDSHIVQCNLYMDALHQEENAELHVDKWHLLYVNKNTAQIRSIFVPYEPEILTPYYAEITEVYNWVRDIQSGTTKVLPQPCSRGTCSCEEITLPNRTASADH